MTTKISMLELNGQSYDSTSGAALGRRITGNDKANQAIDGFIKNPNYLSSPTKLISKPPITNYKLSLQPVAKTSALDNHHNRDTLSPRFASRHRPQHASTLMRQGLEKPHQSLKRSTKINTLTTSQALVDTSNFNIVPKHSVDYFDQERLKRAAQAQKSRLISRFNSVSPPAQRLEPARITSQPLPAAPAVKTTADQPSKAVFDRALAHANSHLQPKVKHRKVHQHRMRRFGGLAAASLAVLLIIGFIAYQNSANIQIRIASAKSGVNATLPSWYPSGFALDKLTYKTNTVALNFDSNNNQAFSIIQTASKWPNSTALFNNYVFPNSDTYEAVQVGKTVVYTYNNNDATWIKNGVWYKLISNGSLSTTQVVNVAASMTS